MNRSQIKWKYPLGQSVAENMAENTERGYPFGVYTFESPFKHLVEEA